MCEDLLPVFFSPVSLFPLTSVCISFHTSQVLHFDHKMHSDGVEAIHSHRPGCYWDIDGLRQITRSKPSKVRARMQTLKAN